MGSVDGVLAGAVCAAVAGLRIALAFILAEAGVHALRDRLLFAAVIEDYRVIPQVAAAPAAVVLPVVEIVVALMLLSPAARVGGACAAVLFGVFAIAMAVNLARGRDSISCGCGGGNSLPISWTLVGRNGVLLAASAGVALSPLGFGRGDMWAAESGFAAFMVAVYFTANQLIGNAHALARLSAGGRRA